MDQLKDELIDSWTDTRENLLTMEENFFSVQNQVKQTDDRVDTMVTQMKSVSGNSLCPERSNSILIQFQDSLNWIMKAMERVKMDKDPPLFEQKSSKLYLYTIRSD